MTFEIKTDDLTHPSTRALLALHLQNMHANSPPDAVFALDLSGLQHPDITVWTAWRDDLAVGVVALRRLGVDQAELKSMRTHPDWLRQGVASDLLDHVISEARGRGIKQLSLETGSGPAFEPALGLYRRRGFSNGDAFGDYAASPFNQFLHLGLDPT